MYDIEIIQYWFTVSLDVNYICSKTFFFPHLLKVNKDAILSNSHTFRMNSTLLQYICTNNTK